MGFLDKAKVLADQAVAKADAAMGSATGGPSPKQADGYLHDLGVIAYLEATGRAPADSEEQRQRCVAAIQQVEGQVALNFALTTVAPPAPGAAATGPAPFGSAVPPAPAAPGAAAAPPPPPGGVAAPPPPAGAPVAPPPAPATPAPATPPPAPAAPIAPPPPPGSVAPPPPPGTV